MKVFKENLVQIETKFQKSASDFQNPERYPGGIENQTPRCSNRKGVVLIKDSIKIPNTKDSGIYMLFNFRNKKIYIGQTENLSRRAYQHLHYFKHGTHPNKEMLKDSNREICFISLFWRNARIPLMSS